MFRRGAVSLAAAVLLLPGAGWAQTTIENTQKYAETSTPVAKGTRGGATLNGRMLYGKDGKTDVELTTGEFDTTAAGNGTIAKVSIRGVDGEGVEMFQLNYTPLTLASYWKETFDKFAPGQPFNIYGLVQTTRKDLVLLSATVRKRPDLYAHGLHVPQQSTVNTPVQVTTTITELNEQVGARADCVLFVDDVEVDRASGIWVDGGDDVTCAFSQAFTTAGTKNLRVDVTNVRPGDWDDANNSVSGSIEVINPTMNYNSAQASVFTSDNYRYDYYESGRYTTSTASGYDWSYESHNNRTGYSEFYYYGRRYDVGNDFLSAIDFSATDGTTTWAVTQPVTTGCYANGSALVNGRTVYWYVSTCGYLYVDVASYAGTVTYMSRQWRRDFTRDANGNEVYDAPSEYFYNAGTTDYGSHRFTGDSININAAVTLSNGTIYSTPLTVSVSTPQAVTYNYGNCSGSSGGGASWSYCWQYDYAYTYRSGYASVYQP